MTPAGTKMRHAPLGLEDGVDDPENAVDDPPAEVRRNQDQYEPEMPRNLYADSSLAVGTVVVRVVIIVVIMVVDVVAEHG